MRPNITRAQAHARLAGRFTMTAHKLDGSSRLLADWFDNLIVDQGLNHIGIGAYITGCAVGDSSTAPTTVDTALGHQIAYTTTTHNSTSGTSTSSPYYGYQRLTYRFAQGVAAGNLTEVGVGWASGPYLFSRALITDVDGNPTTITVLSDEILDVTYEWRLYSPIADSDPYVVTISGVDYTFVTRAASVTGQPHWVPGNTAVTYVHPNGMEGQQAWSGPIGLVTGTPSGTSGGDSSTIMQPYGNNNLYRDMLTTWDLDYGNVGGISSFWFVTSMGTFQMSVSPAIPKDATKILQIMFRISWDRYVP